MADAFSIAISGLLALKRGLGVAASNIANASTGGTIPGESDSPAAVSTVYRPLQVNYVSAIAGGAGAGVSADVTEKENGYSLSYDPQSPYANNEGYIAAPNVDLIEETVNIIETKTLFKANIAVLKVQEEISDRLFDTLA